MPDAVHDVEGLGRAWAHAIQGAPCDRVARWEHGTVVEAAKYPNVYFHNAVRVEEDVVLTADELMSLADAALGSRCHLIVVERANAAAILRDELEKLGWLVLRQVLMIHDQPLAALRPGPTRVSAVDYDLVHELRVQWHAEDFPGVDPGGYFAEQRAIAEASDSTVLARVEKGRPVGFAEIKRIGDDAEITQVYVTPAHRGRGLGTALTGAAIEHHKALRRLWITADADGRPRQLYGRLGFRGAWESTEFLLHA